MVFHINVFDFRLEDTRIDKLQVPLVVAAGPYGLLKRESGGAFRTRRSQIVASEAAMDACRVETTITDWGLACRDIGPLSIGMLQLAFVWMSEERHTRLSLPSSIGHRWGKLTQLLGSKDFHVHRLLTLLLEKKQNFLSFFICDVHRCAVLRLAHL